MDWTHISKLARLFLVLGVAPSLACGDDTGTTGTDDDSSTSADDDDDDDDDGPSTMTDPTTPTEESSTGDTAPTTSSDGSSSSDGGSSDGSTGSTGADSSSSGGDGSSSEGSTTSSVCEPITDDPSAINQDCEGAPCPESYTCQEMVGFQTQHLCEIICVEDCDCPEDHYCAKHSDKTMVPWFQCDAL